MKNVGEMTALALAEAIRKGTVSAVDAAKACLARIDQRDETVKAFTHLHPEHTIAIAENMDTMRKRGNTLGALHGVPVALKDIIDTIDFPTENGLKADQGRRATKDAFIVQKLRAAGANIIGKAATTEAAYYQPAPTRNPHNPAHTPGGSSAGPAAAVADKMVPFSVGTQTNGSVIRPASFCGVVGFKPSFGQIARTGILELSPTLDQVGTFANTIEDAAFLADILAGADGVDPSVAFQPLPGFLRYARSKPPVTPAFAFIPAPDWQEKAPGDAKAAFSELLNAIGDVDSVPLPLIFRECLTMHRVIMATEMSRHLARYGKNEAAISDPLAQILEEGKTILAHDYMAALDWRRVFENGLEEVFERYDAIITPASYGAAPADLTQTGDAGACTLWTYCGFPAISLPLLVGDNEMPMGVQLIGPKGGDGRLLRTANWLVQSLSASE